MLITGPAIVRRQVGRRLKLLRRDAGLTVEQVAENPYVGISRAKLYKLESGTLRVRPQDVAMLCGHYRAPGRDSEALMTLALATQGEGWWHNYTEDTVPKWFDLYVSLEDAASSIAYYQLGLVPGLVQTRAYAREIMRAPTGKTEPEEGERRVQVRMERQAILSRPNPPQLDIIINEAVLRHLVGSAEVMAEQLRHLLEIGRREKVSIRVLPIASGVHGLQVSGFVLLEFPQEDGEPLEPPVAYFETITGAIYLQGIEEVHVYRLNWDDLNRHALDEGSSASMIAAIMDEWQ